MHLQAIWRYPVKSMAGEPLESAEVGPLGVEGDRQLWVRAGAGRILTSRTHPGLLGLKGSLAPDGGIRVNGLPWDAPEVRALVHERAGEDAVLSPSEGRYRFDVLPLLVATDGALQAFGRDPRRLRPNLIISGVEGLGEREWPGRVLRVGAVSLRVHDVRQRCVMTTFDPDTQAQDLGVLKDLVHRFGGRMALDVEVETPGRVKVGDPVELLG